MNDSRQADIAALLLRLTLGTAFLAHGLLKVLVFTVPGTIAFFESVGLPGLLAPLVIAAELIGGALLLAGIAVRWTSLALVPILLGAWFTHLPAGWVFSNEGGGWEYPAFWLATLLVQALLGPGLGRLPAPRMRPA